VPSRREYRQGARISSSAGFCVGVGDAHVQGAAGAFFLTLALLLHCTGNAAISSAAAIKTNAQGMAARIRAWIKYKIISKTFCKKNNQQQIIGNGRTCPISKR
jgi:hypothetical protein